MYAKNINSNFNPKIIATQQGLNIEFNIKEQHYLYKNKIKISANKNIFEKITFPKSLITHDDFFGKQKIYRDFVQISINYKKTNLNPYPYNLKLSFQGCSDKGICYNPEYYQIKIDKEGIFTLKKDKTEFNQFQGNNSYSKFNISKNNVLLNILIFFLAGLGLSFTACMYPLIPIISSIIIGNNITKKKQAFFLSLIYTQGIAFTYTIMGIVAGLTGSLLIIWFQKSWVIYICTFLIVILALSMFGLFNLQIPLFIQNYLNKKTSLLKGGKYYSVFLMGILSSLIIGPCLAPPLAFTIGYIGQTQNAILGGIILYFIALGIGTPLLIISLSANILPKSGKWMNFIKIIFGFILLTVALYLIKPYITYNLTIIILSLILLIFSITTLYYSKYINNTLGKAIMVIIAISLIIANGYFTYFSYLHKNTFIHNIFSIKTIQNNNKNVYQDVQKLEKAITKAFKDNPNKLILIDFYATWCISCIKMDMKTFANEEVKKYLHKTIFFTIDISNYTKKHQELLNKYNIVGPPALILMKNNKIIDVIIGYIESQELIEWLKKHE